MLIESQIADCGGDMRETQLWLPTYAALCTLLLAFFVVLYSLAEHPRKDHSQALLRKQVLEIQARVFSDIRAFIAQNGMEAGMDAVLEDVSITLRVSEGTLFAPGTEHFLPAGLKTLNQLKDLFVVQRQQTIHIRSYTDDAPMPSGARFRNDWELSALRAAHILRHLLAQGIEPGRLSATGFGMLEPLFPNTTEENRAKNRRVEFVLELRLGKE